MKGRKFVIKQLHEWAASEMVRLNIKTKGDPKKGAPVVFLEQFSSEAVEGFKNSDTYDCSMLFDIVSRSSSVTEAYDVAETIMQGLDFSTAPFGVNSYNFNGNNGNVEVDDVGVVVIQRQPLRLELQITLNY